MAGKPTTDADQVKSEAARELECDESEEGFEDKLRRLAKAAQPKNEPKTNKSDR